MTNESAQWRRRIEQQLTYESIRGRSVSAGERTRPNSASAGVRGIMAAFAFAIGIIAGSAPAHATDDDVAATIKFADHHWDPLNVQVPANQPLKIHVVNASNEMIEFESFRLNRETAMTPGQTITVKLPALSPGSYDFYDDFHQDVPQGTIVAK
jgi:hypothetical protein